MPERTNRRPWLVYGALALLVVAGIYAWRTLSAPAMATRTEALPEPVRFPAMSPDGRLLAFSDNNTRLVRVMDTAGGNVTEVGAGDISGVAWSADSRYLFAPGFEGTDSIYDLQAGSVRPIPDVTFKWWAADGPWLAAMAPDRSVRLWEAGGSAEPVPLFPAGIEPLVVNGHGPSLGLRRGGAVRELVRVDRPGAAAQVVDSGFTGVFAAPNGRTWVVTRGDGGLEVQVDGEAAKPLAPAGRYYDYEGAWSPDGRWVALIGKNRQSRNEEFLLFDAAGTRRGQSGAPFSQSRRLAADREIWWSPDSRYCAFVSVSDGLTKANWVHRFDVTARALQTGRLPYESTPPLRDFAFADAHTLFATLRGTLYRFDLD